MRVRWKKRDARNFTARIGKDTLDVWESFAGSWSAEFYDATQDLCAQHYSLPSERAAKREAVRMWRALRGAK